jgi:hypothetical protein
MHCLLRNLGHLGAHQSCSQKEVSYYEVDYRTYFRTVHAVFAAKYVLCMQCLLRNLGAHQSCSQKEVKPYTGHSNFDAESDVVGYSISIESMLYQNYQRGVGRN